MSPHKKNSSLSLYQNTQKTIWAVGGGKGGTGKSFIAASLAIYLASIESDVVLIDADLGGPNLHTFLGMNHSNRDLGHFFSNQIKKLEDTVVFTPFDGLRLIKGTDRTPFMANLNYYKKLKFIRHVKAFDAKRVIIDIGTGTSFNDIDFFILSNPGILVINPEPTSIENAYYFLRTCLIRILKSHIEYHKLQGLIKKIAEDTDDHSRSIYGFLEAITSYDKSYAKILFRALKDFTPCLIMNKAKEDRDFLLGESMVDIIHKYLVVKANYLGAVPYDENVPLSLKNLAPYLTHHSDCEAAVSIRGIVDKLISQKK